MSDDDLIARLRAWDGTPFDDDAEAAADRIEALVKERDEALEWLSASQGYIADAVFALDKQEKAEARAKRLEAALREIAAEASVTVHTWKNGINFKKMYGGWRKIATERIDIARATLKGDDHE